MIYFVFSASEHPCIPEQRNVREGRCGGVGLSGLSILITLITLHHFKVIRGVPAPQIVWFKDGLQLFPDRFLHIQDGRVTIKVFITDLGHKSALIAI